MLHSVTRKPRDVPTAGVIGCVSGLERMLGEGPEIARCVDRVEVLPMPQLVKRHQKLSAGAPQTSITQPTVVKYLSSSQLALRSFQLFNILIFDATSII